MIAITQVVMAVSQKQKLSQSHLKLKGRVIPYQGLLIVRSSILTWECRILLTRHPQIEE